ncbi:hypothetical protein SAMN05444169_7034 [Bradyrhizobium erythrophlei]|jgi:hypothetical protein|uniref:Uncharacterized protein n=2 Tax=Bradyrhizobium erythrophlei TaxID=1437360 RepID=A0A1M5SAI3_9BRAD|nr:hypothetical protein SAMN05444169_7034 [Bradyrhizobium erythrophlei]
MTVEQKPEFLHALPIGLIREQRMLLEAVGYAADMLELAVSRLEQNVTSFVKRAPRHLDISVLERRALFLDVWAAVDQAHNLGTFLRGAAQQEVVDHPVLRDYRASAENARLARNKMDHLAGNLRNLANREQATLPLYGAFKFFWIDKVEEGRVTGGHITIFGAGAYHHGSSKLTIPDVRGRELDARVGLFSLEAFGIEVDLSELATKSARVRSFLNSEFAEHTRRGIAAAARKRGEDPDAAIEQVPGPMSFDQPLGFGPDEPDSHLPG